MWGQPGNDVRGTGVFGECDCTREESRTPKIPDPLASHREKSPDHPKVGTVRYPRLVLKKEECAKERKKRTLTNLHNQRPTWLDLAHQNLAAAVFAAYGWSTTLSDDELLAKLLALNLERAGKEMSRRRNLSKKTVSQVPWKK